MVSWPINQTLLLLLVLFLSGYSQCAEFVGNREVKYMTVPQNWHTAFEICRAEGGELLSVHNDQEYEQVKVLANKYNTTNIGPSIWLAANDLGQEGSFVWTMTGKRVSYAKFRPNQPDNSNGNEHCLEITWRWNDVAWNDTTCSTKFPYFCQRIPTCNSCKTGCGC